MSTSDHPAQAPPEPSAAAVATVLPPPRPRATDRPAVGRTLGLLLVGVVLLFTFLASSFAVRNSDFWFHLAGGRLLAEGRYTFGVDPFRYTGGQEYWTNHAWLFDLLLFGLYEKAGGAALVVLKALLITALAGLMLSVRRPGGRLLPAACTLLAVLAMSPRWLLQPACVSYILLGLTFWLLWRPHARSDRQARSASEETEKPLAGASGLSVPRLLFVFVLWVNVDGWFLLGPLLVSLFWLGERLRGQRQTPGWLVPVGLAVCLLNPHTYHAFTLPENLVPLPAALRGDPRFTRLYVSPWQLGLPYHAAGGLNLAATAYFALTGLGLVSFLAAGRRAWDWRLLVWTAFAVLAAWTARAVPFFAVVAGPITALNLQDVLSTRDQLPTLRSRFVLRASCFLFVASGLALVVLAWGGWLQGFGGGRRPEWAVQPDASLRRVAETLRDWRRDGKLTEDDHGFQTHPSVVHYCAWFCPGEKGFFDHRFGLAPQTAEEFEAVCRALEPGLGEAEPRAPGWRRIFREHAVTYVVLYDPDWGRMLPALKKLDDDPARWPRLHLDGQAVLFGWSDGSRTLPAGVAPLDVARLALAPTSDEESMLPPAPGRGPGRGPRPTDFWSHFLPPPPPPPWEADAASVCLRGFEDAAERQLEERAAVCWGGYAAGLVGQPVMPAGPLPTASLVVGRLQSAGLFVGDLGERPPALPLLAVRAARRALAEGPDDAGGYLRLGQAYLSLRGATAERAALGRLPPLALLRQVQIATALENALVRNPDLEAAHQTLAELYAERDYLDVSLQHRQAQLRLARRAGPRPGETAEAFGQRLERLEASTAALEATVLDRRNELTISGPPQGTDPFGRAVMALRLGLPRLALEDVLAQAPLVLLGGNGVRLEVQLQLMLGRCEEARGPLNDPDWKANRKNLGALDLPAPPGAGPVPPCTVPAYEWLLLCQSAAVGDYDQADAAVRTILQEWQTEHERDRRLLSPALRRAVAFEVGLSAQPQPLLRRLVGNERQMMTLLLSRAFSRVREQADLEVLAGMLALERGQPARADEAFARALELCRTAESAGQQCGGKALALRYRELIRNARRDKPGGR